jgi:hypothetical protein
MSKIEIDKDGTEWITDDIGGTHSEGIGWNPQGLCCGECSYTTCVECSVRNVTPEDAFVFENDPDNE